MILSALHVDVLRARGQKVERAYPTEALGANATCRRAILGAKRGDVPGENGSSGLDYDKIDPHLFSDPAGAVSSPSVVASGAAGCSVSLKTQDGTLNAKKNKPFPHLKSHLRVWNVPFRTDQKKTKKLT